MPQSTINLIRWMRESFAQYRHRYYPETYEWQDYKNDEDDDDDAWQLTRAGGRV